jgi:hypothetical protein
LGTDRYFICSIFQDLKQWSGVSFEFGQTVSAHSQIIYPEHQDILFLGGLLGNRVIYLQSTFLADGLAAATSSHSIKETLAI